MLKWKLVQSWENPNAQAGNREENLFMPRAHWGEVPCTQEWICNCTSLAATSTNPAWSPNQIVTPLPISTRRFGDIFNCTQRRSWLKRLKQASLEEPDNRISLYAKNIFLSFDKSSFKKILGFIQVSQFSLHNFVYGPNTQLGKLDS